MILLMKQRLANKKEIELIYRYDSQAVREYNERYVPEHQSEEISLKEFTNSTMISVLEIAPKFKLVNCLYINYDIEEGIMLRKPVLYEIENEEVTLACDDEITIIPNGKYAIENAEEDLDEILKRIEGMDERVTGMGDRIAAADNIIKRVRTGDAKLTSLLDKYKKEYKP